MWLQTLRLEGSPVADVDSYRIELLLLLPKLLKIDDAQSSALRLAIAEGDEIRKPGFTRLNFSVLLSDDKVQYILDSVAQLAQDAATYSDQYMVDPSRAIFYPRNSQGQLMSKAV